jgi:sugar lactone lactonase YvrE
MNPLTQFKKTNETITRIIYAAFAVVILAIGTLTASGEPGDLFASINGGLGNGVGFIYQYTPDGVQSTVASGLSRPRGLAFDSEGNLFVATNFASNTIEPTILKVMPGGTQDLFATLPNSFFFAQGLAIDGSDNVFVMGNFKFLFSRIYKFTPDGTRIPFAFLPGRTGSEGFGLAFDSMGNLFAADAVAQTIYKFAPDGTGSIFVGPEAFTDLDTGPIGLAFDHFGNLFVSTEAFPFTDDKILKFTPSGVRSTFATGLTEPRGLAFDSAGNLFVGEIPFFATGDILKFTPDGTRTVFASGIGDPQGFGGPTNLAIQP